MKISSLIAALLALLFLAESAGAQSSISFSERGLTPAAAVANYLKLDASNDPITGELTTSNGGFRATGATVALVLESGFAATVDVDTAMRVSFSADLAAADYAIRYSDAGSTLLDLMGDGATRFVDGTAAVPAQTFIADPDTGIYRSAANTIGFTTDGVGRVTLSTTNLDPITDNAIAFGTAALRYASARVVNGYIDNTISANLYDTSPVIRINFTNAGKSTYTATTALTADPDIGHTLYVSTNFVAADKVLQWGDDGTVELGSVNGVGDVQIDGVLGLPDGTAALPALTFTSDPDIGIYRYGDNVLGFTTAGVYRGRFDGTVLHLAGALTAASGYIRSPVHAAANGATRVTFTDDGKTASIARTALTADPDLGHTLFVSTNFVAADKVLQWGDDLTTELGYVTGIGDMQIDGVLELPAGTAALPALTFTADLNTGILNSAANVLGFTTDGASRVTLSTTNLDPVTDNAIAFGTAALRYASARAVNGYFNNTISENLYDTSPVIRINFTSAGKSTYTATTALTADPDIGHTLYVSTNFVALDKVLQWGDDGTVELGSVSGIGDMQIDGVLGLPAGTAALPALTFTADLDTGILNSAADTIALTTAGVSRVTLSTTNLDPVTDDAVTLGTAALRYANLRVVNGYINNVVSVNHYDTAPAMRLNFTNAGKSTYTATTALTTDPDIGHTLYVTTNFVAGDKVLQWGDDGTVELGSVNGVGDTQIDGDFTVDGADIKNIGSALKVNMSVYSLANAAGEYGVVVGTSDVTTAQVNFAVANDADAVDPVYVLEVDGVGNTQIDGDLTVDGTDIKNILSVAGPNMRIYSKADAADEFGVIVGTSSDTTAQVNFAVANVAGGAPVYVFEVNGVGNMQLDGVFTGDGTGTNDLDGILTGLAFIPDKCDSTGTPGAATCDKYAGRAAIKAAEASVKITNDKVVASSSVFAQLATVDADCLNIRQVVPAAGSFTIYVNAACGAASNVAWEVP